MFRLFKTLVFTAAIILSTLISYSQDMTNQENPPQKIQNETEMKKTTEIKNEEKTSKLISVQEDPQNKLGLIHSVMSIEQATTLFNEGKYSEAEEILLMSVEWLSYATEMHYDLYKVLSKGSNTINQSNIEKAHALDFGHLRDQIYFLLAKVYIVQNKFKDALPLLVGIVKSQDGSSLATDAYKALIEMKFSDQVK